MDGPALRYDVSLDLVSPALRDRFVALSRDEATERWLAEYTRRPHGAVTSLLVRTLASFASVYDVHGWLGAYQMHLLSTAQLTRLLGAARLPSLLDVGAGAGYVTSEARPLFDEVVCTETSSGLRRRLVQRGFDARAVDLAQHGLARTFSLVACLNVLDRTARPLTLLDALVRHLTPEGRLLLSVPLPVNAHVQVAGGTASARERLPAQARSFELAVNELSAFFEARTGLVLQAFSRVPYLSRGDGGAPYYVLDAGLWLLGPAL